MSRKGNRTRNSVRLSVNLPKDLMEQFNQYCKEVGQTKTMAAERILWNFFWEREQDKAQWREIHK